MSVLEWMGEHPILTFFLVLIVMGGLHDIVVGIWGKS